MNVNYYLKDSKKDKSAITAIIRFKGERYKLAPGVTVLAEFWDPENKRVLSKKNRKRYNDAERINITLDRFEGDIKKIFEPHILNRTKPTTHEIKAALTDEAKHPTQPTHYFTDYFKEYYENTSYKLQTWKKYNTTYNWLVKYEQRTGQRLTFDTVNLDFYEHFKTWILNKKYIRASGELPRNYSINYFGSLIKCIKKVMAHTGPKGRLKYHNNSEFSNIDFKVTTEPADTIYLSVDELMKMHRFTATPENIKPLFDRKKTPDDQRPHNMQKKADALNLAKNKFMIGAFTALRVSDFNRLDEVNIAANVIKIHPVKGTAKNEPIVIPIHQVIKEILKTGFNIATPVSDQKINKHIKEVGQLVGINQPVTTARTEGTKVVERTEPKYKLISTHTARRSGATNMYLAGVPSISIMKITGHKTERSFMKYLKITQEENARLLADHPFFK